MTKRGRRQFEILAHGIQKPLHAKLNVVSKNSSADEVEIAMYSLVFYVVTAFALRTQPGTRTRLAERVLLGALHILQSNPLNESTSTEDTPGA